MSQRTTTVTHCDACENEIVVMHYQLQLTVSRQETPPLLTNDTEDSNRDACSLECLAVLLRRAADRFVVGEGFKYTLPDGAEGD